VSDDEWVAADAVERRWHYNVVSLSDEWYARRRQLWL